MSKNAPQDGGQQMGCTLQRRAPQYLPLLEATEPSGWEHMTERCERCRRPLQEHGTLWQRRGYEQVKCYICPDSKGHAVGPD